MFNKVLMYNLEGQAETSFVLFQINPELQCTSAKSTKKYFFYDDYCQSSIRSPGGNLACQIRNYVFCSVHSTCVNAVVPNMRKV